MVLRQLGKTPEEKADFIQKSVDHAKEAVQMDFKDGTSWCKLSVRLSVCQCVCLSIYL